MSHNTRRHHRTNKTKNYIHDAHGVHQDDSEIPAPQLKPHSVHSYLHCLYGFKNVASTWTIERSVHLVYKHKAKRCLTDETVFTHFYLLQYRKDDLTQYVEHFRGSPRMKWGWNRGWLSLNNHHTHERGFPVLVSVPRRIHRGKYRLGHETYSWL